VSGAIPVLARMCLPGPVLRRALRIALLPPEVVRCEWPEWQSDDPPAEALLRHPAQRLRRLIPLIDAALRCSNVPLETPFKSFLRMGTAHEKMRWEVVERLANAALASLMRQQMEFLVVRGMALASSVYPQPSLRHCHDLDLLVRPGQADRAAHCLGAAGFIPATPPPGSDGDSRWMLHPSGFPIGIHVRLFRLAPWNREDGLPSASCVQTVAGQAVRTLEPPEMLAAVCVHAATVGSVHSPAWVTDAWRLLATYPAIDWDRVLAFGPALPLWLTLQWLQQELGAPVPAGVIAMLSRAAARCDAASLQQATAAAMLCAMGRPGELLRSAQDAGECFTWIRQLALPETPILRWIEHSEEPRAVLHFRRLRRFVGGHGWR
jgi:hypothetical protein